MLYKAFISYNHSADRQLAPALQSALHKFTKPWYRLRALRVFRDKSNLGVQPGLWSSIEKSLSESEYLILLASPQAAASPWVQREIDYWLSHRSIDHILLALTDGELVWDRVAGDFDWGQTSALPRNLEKRFKEEPSYIDLRWAKTTERVSLTDPRFRDAIADLAVPLHGLNKDEVIGEDVHQHRIFKRIASGAITLLVLLLAASILATVYATRQQGIAENQRLRAETSAQSERKAKDAAILAAAAEREAREEADEAAKNERMAKDTAEERRREAEHQRQIAEKRQRLAVGRQLAAQATTFLINNELDSALLFAIKGFRTDNNFDTRDSLLSALEQSPQLITFLRGHTGGLNAPQVHDIAFHPNGRVIASAGEDRRVILWDVETRLRLEDLASHPSNAIKRIAFSPDGELLATLGLDGVWVWKVADGSEVTRLRGRHGELTSLAFSPDGKSLATGDCIRVANRRCIEGQVMVWDARSGAPLRAPLTGHTGWVMDVAFHSQGQILASCSSDGTVQIWNLLTGQRVGDPLRGHTRSVHVVAFSTDGNLLASTGADRTIRLWNTVTRQPQGDPLIGHDGGVFSVAFSSDGAILASASEDKTVRLWEVSTGKPVGEPIRGHRAAVNKVVFSPKGSMLASGSDDNTVMVANLAASSPIAVLLDQLKGSSRGLAFSPNAHLLASGGSTGSIKVWDVAQRKQLREWSVAQGSREIRDKSGRIISSNSSHLFIESLAFHPNGKILASGSLDGALELRDVLTGQQIGNPFRHPGSVRSVAFSSDGKLLASAGSRASIVLWDTESQKLVATLKGHRTEEPGVNAPHQLDVYAVAFSPDGKVLASGSFDKTIIFWDVAARKPLGPPLVGHRNWVDSIAFHPNGRVLASADVEGVILLWDIVTGQPVGPALRMPATGYTRIAFSPDGRVIAACGSARLVMLWDTLTGEAITHPFQGPVGQFETIAFSPDGKTISTGDFNGRILLWDVSIDSWLNRACLKANRNLSANEWARVAPGAPYERICPQLPYPASVVEQTLEKAKAAGKTRQAKASELYKQASDQAIKTDDAGLNNRVCWFGSIDGLAQTVIPACERAVTLAPRDGGWRDTRAIARSLTGNLRGAVEDLQFFLHWAENRHEYQRYVPKRKQWIAELMAGHNPFDTRMLSALRDEE